LRFRDLCGVVALAARWLKKQDRLVICGLGAVGDNTEQLSYNKERKRAFFPRIVRWMLLRFRIRRNP
jgi:hypothetical protein